jgi:hypothetical protein
MNHIARDKRDHKETIVRAITLKPHKRLLALGIVVLALCLIAPASALAEESRAANPDFAAIDAYIQKEMREVSPRPW